MIAARVWITISCMLPCAAAAATSGFPDASNTGLKTTTGLTKYSGTLVIDKPGTVISNMEITGNIVVQADNVTIQNVKLISTTPYHAIYVPDGHDGFKLEDSEIDGRGNTDNGVLGNGTFERNNVHGVDNGINVTGPSMIRDNFIHSLQGGSDAHYDGIEVNGGHDIQILHNTIINDHGQTSAIMLDNYFSGLSNITVDGNRLVGGGYTVYLDHRFSGGPVDASSIKITNNQIGDGHYGDFAFYDSKPVVSGNTELSR